MFAPTEDSDRFSHTSGSPRFQLPDLHQITSRFRRHGANRSWREASELAKRTIQVLLASVADRHRDGLHARRANLFKRGCGANHPLVRVDRYTKLRLKLAVKCR